MCSEGLSRSRWCQRWTPSPSVSVGTFVVFATTIVISGDGPAGTARVSTPLRMAGRIGEHPLARKRPSQEHIEVPERTAHVFDNRVNQKRNHIIVFIVPDLEHTARRLPGPSLDQIAAWLAGTPSSVQVAICQELTVTIGALTARIDQLTGELRQRVARLAPTCSACPAAGR